MKLIRVVLVLFLVLLTIALLVPNAGAQSLAGSPYITIDGCQLDVHWSPDVGTSPEDVVVTIRLLYGQYPYDEDWVHPQLTSQSPAEWVFSHEFQPGAQMGDVRYMEIDGMKVDIEPQHSGPISSACLDIADIVRVPPPIRFYRVFLPLQTSGF